MGSPLPLKLMVGFIAWNNGAVSVSAEKFELGG